MRYMLEVNEYLSIIEEIFKKYMDIDHDLLIFVKHERYPVVDKKILSKIKNNSLISNTPFVPYLCVDCVRELILNRIYLDSTMDVAFRENPLLENGGNKNLLPLSYNDYDIISTYNLDIPIDDIDNVYQYIIRWVNKLYKEVIRNYTRGKKENLFDIDIKSTGFILIDLGNIKTYRYNEVFEYRSNNTLKDDDGDDIELAKINKG